MGARGGGEGMYQGWGWAERSQGGGEGDTCNTSKNKEFKLKDNNTI